jgi:hypothetical protein
MLDDDAVLYPLPWDATGHSCGQFLADLSGRTAAEAIETYCSGLAAVSDCSKLIEMFGRTSAVGVVDGTRATWYRKGWYLMIQVLGKPRYAPGRLLVRSPTELCPTDRRSLPNDGESQQLAMAMSVLSGLQRERHGSFQLLSNLPSFDREYLEPSFPANVVEDCVGTYELCTAGSGETILYRPGDGFFWYDWGAGERQDICDSTEQFVAFVMQEVEHGWYQDRRTGDWLHDPFEMYRTWAVGQE